MKAGTSIAQISTANSILPMLAPENSVSTSVQVHSSVVGMKDGTPGPESNREGSVEKL